LGFLVGPTTKQPTHTPQDYLTVTRQPPRGRRTTTIKAVADRPIETGHEVCFVAPGPGLATYNRSRVVRHLLGERGRELARARDWRAAVDELVAAHYPTAPQVTRR
jgi:hypothetical protein